MEQDEPEARGRGDPGAQAPHGCHAGSRIVRRKQRLILCLLDLEARSFRGEIAAVPLWKVIVGAAAGKLVNRTPMGPVFFISGAGGDARLHATELPL